MKNDYKMTEQESKLEMLLSFDNPSLDMEDYDMLMKIIKKNKGECTLRLKNNFQEY
jgi:hypothetical protein